jgi:TM2 domain-containing membrane protein YozV
MVQRVLVDQTGAPVSDKSRLAATLLCFFLGLIGVHRFYVGKVGTGVLQIVTIGGLGIWTLIDLITIIVGGFRDIYGRLLINW